MYELPSSFTDEGPAKVLLVENASPSRDGSTRLYGLLPDPASETVMQAQASLAGLTVEQYQLIEVCT